MGGLKDKPTMPQSVGQRNGFDWQAWVLARQRHIQTPNQ